MKIAFVVSFFEFRNDVRRIIAEVQKQHEVVVFGRPEHKVTIQAHLAEGVEFRLINEKSPSIWNYIWEHIFLLFKAIPKSKNNFFLMERFKASLIPEGIQRNNALKLLNWIKRLPKFIDYDTYLNQLHFNSSTYLEDINQFIFFTSITDDYLLARLIAEKKDVMVYVYSWDHPCKHICFSKRVRYSCWSEGIGEDIITLQNIPSEKVSVTGASQFGYIHEYNQTKNNVTCIPFRYIYFGCAIGIPELVAAELQLIKILARNLEQVQPNWKLLLRPYPVLNNWSYYEELGEIPNLVFDNQFRTQDTSVKDIDILKKYATIEQAEAFFHLGTTMGLEACFTNTPSFILDFGYTTKEGLSLYNFIHQYQNDRHLIKLAPQNAITTEETLRQILKNPSEPIYQLLNQQIQQQYVLKSFATFAADLISF